MAAILLRPSWLRRLAAALALASLSTPAPSQTYGGGLMDVSTVTFVNLSRNALYVAFSVEPGRPGPVVWSNGCERFNDQVYLPQGQSCAASVPSGTGASRFCAAGSPQPPGKTPNCFTAQRDNLTIIETNFAGGSGCNPATQKSCVWYAVNVTPEDCTYALWSKNKCGPAPVAGGVGDTSGAAYNVPVRLACGRQPPLTCRGPIDTATGYPAHCGTPGSKTCIGGLNPSCVQAYFHPMTRAPADVLRPTLQCRQGETLVVQFLAGP